jgi:hypothetical protein
VYLFHGYAINSIVEPIPRTHLVTVEYVSDVFGVQYRTSRHTIKKETGAYGLWMKVLAPDLPVIDEEAAGKAAKYPRPVKEVTFVE